MNKLIRVDAPKILTEEMERKYGKRYKQNRERKPNFKFNWPKPNGQPLNQQLLPTLLEMSQKHCFYYDTAPLYLGDNTIDHFYPKTNPKYYELVCQWTNLYLSCRHCQEAKWEADPIDVIRPDEIIYEFEDYFLYDFTYHKINPNPLLNELNKKRALATIKIFQFNHESKTTARRHEYERYYGKKATNDIIVQDDFAFRFMFD